jgi:hypothetical protein
MKDHQKNDMNKPSTDANRPGEPGKTPGAAGTDTGKATDTVNSYNRVRRGPRGSWAATSSESIILPGELRTGCRSARRARPSRTRRRTPSRGLSYLAFDDDNSTFTMAFIDNRSGKICYDKGRYEASENQIIFEGHGMKDKMKMKGLGQGHVQGRRGQGRAARDGAGKTPDEKARPRRTTAWTGT